MTKAAVTPDAEASGSPYCFQPPASRLSMPLAQASAIPFRWRNGELEFCLITSIRARRWGFPKGIIDPGETAVEAALKEAWEEAGLRGEIVSEPLGVYRYEKWGTDLEVAVYLMRVESADDDWLEAGQRDRRWANAQETAQLIIGDKRAPFFERALALAISLRSQ